MNWGRGALLVTGIVLGLWLPLAAAQEAPAAATRAPARSSGVVVDGKDLSEMSTIEEASLEGLLDLDLEDQLGETEAVSRAAESILRAPASMTTLDAVQIRLSGATTVPDVLRSVPGVAVFRSAPGSYVVSLRGTGGLAANNIILLVDGVPFSNPLDGTVSWDLIPIDILDIERIEVVRGPISPSYGANAYTGVINIVTRTSIGLSPSYAARARGGTDFDGGFTGSVAGRFLHITERLELKLFGRVEHDGLATAPAFPTDLLVDERPTSERGSLLAALKLRTSSRSSISTELGMAWGQRSGMDHLALDSESQRQRLLFGRALFSLQGSAAERIDVWLQGITFGIDADRSERTGFSYDGAHSARGVLGTDLTLPFTGFASVLLGGQLSLERIEAPFVHPDATGTLRPAYGFYGGVKATPTETLDLILMARADSQPISTQLTLSYRASAVYHADTWGMRLTAASAFRAPTYVEATGRFVDEQSGLILLEGTDSIQAPRNTSLELGANFSPHSQLIVSPTLYVSRLSNLMVEDFESVLRRTFRNDPEPRSYLGAELEAQWRVSDKLSIMPSMTMLQWLQASDRIDTNLAVPSQNSQYIGALRLLGLFGDERWGYGATAIVASGREYNVRTGIPPTVLTTSIPTIVRVTASVERQILQIPSFWASLRLGISSPGDTPESPLPLAAPVGHSAIFGLELRRD